MDKMFLYSHLHWFHQKYYKNLKCDPFDYGRYPTMKAALNLLHQRNGKLILETGCQREKNDWGGGCSTQVFSDYLHTYGGKLISVDNSAEHLEVAKTVIDRPEVVEFVLSDSVSYLRQNTQTIDLLYLDSFDFPYGTLLDDFGGKEDLDAAREKLNRLDEASILVFYEDVITPCQDHCLKELQAALTHMHSKSIVLLDDAYLPGGGKTRLARDFLLSTGWTLLMSGYQLLFVL